MGELALWQGVAHEHGLDRLQIEFRGQIHHCQIFVVELAMLLRGIAIAAHQVHEQVLVRLDVPVEIHGHEAVELQESRIDVPHEAGMWKGHLGDDVAPEPIGPALLGKAIDRCRIGASVDRPAHEHHGVRHIGVAVRLHARDRRKHRHRRLADRNDVAVAAQKMQDRDHVIDVVVEIEAAERQRHHARIDPFRDVDVVIGQEGLDRTAQQSGIMTRHRRDQQHTRLRPPRRALEDPLEMQ